MISTPLFAGEDLFVNCVALGAVTNCGKRHDSAVHLEALLLFLFPLPETAAATMESQRDEALTKGSAKGIVEEEVQGRVNSQ